jgi:hypothetical protein
MLDAFYNFRFKKHLKIYYGATTAGAPLDRSALALLPAMFLNLPPPRASHLKTNVTRGHAPACKPRRLYNPPIENRFRCVCPERVLAEEKMGFQMKEDGATIGVCCAPGCGSTY